MFERDAQVNATFTGGLPRHAELVAELRALGLREDQVHVIERADKGNWQQDAPPGLWARWRGRGGPTAEAPADLLVLVHLGQDDTLAAPVQDLFRRFGAASVGYYPAAHIPTRNISEGAVDEGEAANFRAAFPEGERRNKQP